MTLLTAGTLGLVLASLPPLPSASPPRASAAPADAPAAAVQEPATAVGRAIPTFTLIDLGGRERSFDELRGEVTLVNFWATWCIPCQAEMPDLDALYRDYADRGLVVVGIALDSEPGPVEEFLEESVSVTYPILLADGNVQEIFGGVPGIPMTFVLDADGVVRRSFIGFRYRATFEEAIVPLLGAEESS